MSSPASSPHRPDLRPEEFGHPRGTLAIVVVFGALFALGWLAMSILQLMAPGVPRP